MKTKERMDYILNNDKYIRMYMNMHTNEVKNKTVIQKIKGI